MRLHHQLLLLSLLLLSLPWAGCQYILGIDATLKSAQEQSLTATTQAIAAVIAQEPEKIYPNLERLQELLAEEANTQNHLLKQNEIFFNPIQFPVIIDGYSDEWVDVGAIELTNKLTTPDQTDYSIGYRTGAKENRLYLFFDIKDKDVIYYNPTASPIINGDRLVLVTGDLTHYILSTSAPGIIKTFYKDTHQKLHYQPSIKAAWQDNGYGYTIEVSLPLALTNGHLGFYSVNESAQAAPITLGTITDTPESLPAWFVYQPKDLSGKLAIFNQSGTRIKVIDKHFWLLSQTGDLRQSSTKHGHWLVRKLYRAILSGKHQGNPSYQETANYIGRKELHNALINIPDNRWYTDPNNPAHSILSSAVPVRVGGQVIAAVLAEQSSDRFVALTDKAFNQLLLISLGTLAITGLGLLGYASWLSWRIGKLSQAAQNVLGEDGNLQNTFPSSNASDEIGDLTRSYNTLLRRIGDYTHYLQTLSRKLSHELRTPLAIIHSSLDNLEQCLLHDNAKTYHLRAKEGAIRLGNILTAMSEATRVEQSIQNAESEPVNLAALLHSVTAAYRDVYTDHNIRLHGIQSSQLNDQAYVTDAVPDLIVQMLDKLIDNAVDFCPKQGSISLSFESSKTNFIIAVSNDGPLLPETMQHQLFDNMVCLREEHGKQSHLGLGLHIVHLIVQYHNGKINAANQDNGMGVTFTIVLPKK